MATIEQPLSVTRTGLVLAWSFTVVAILAIGIVVATAPLPQLSAAATTGTGLALPATTPAAAEPLAATRPVRTGVDA